MSVCTSYKSVRRGLLVTGFVGFVSLAILLLAYVELILWFINVFVPLFASVAVSSLSALVSYIGVYLLHVGVDSFVQLYRVRANRGLEICVRV
ncbi:MAG: hypothetical protein ABWW65_05985 [Thermoprotei archaeon]